MAKVNADPRTCEALYELQVEAFIEGLSDYEPSAEEYGLEPAAAGEIVGRVVSGLPAAGPS
jgi:hypothetical protein